MTDYSFVGPPLLNHYNGSAIGLMVKRSNVIASLAQFVSGLGNQPNPTEFTRYFSTFGQVVCRLSSSTKLSILGLLQVPKFSSQLVNLGTTTSMPMGTLRNRNNDPENYLDASGPLILINNENTTSGSIALVLESELDESTRVGGWVEMRKSNPRHVQWAVTMTDTPEEEFGWGLSLGGLVQGPKNWDHFQAEAFMKLNFGSRFSLKPALLYVMDGSTQFPALMVRSNWSL